jgi:synaptobrevin family protein YKT6
MKIVGIYIVNIIEKKCRYKDQLQFVNVFSRGAVSQLMHEFAIHAAESINDQERKIFQHEQFSFSCQRQNEWGIVIVTDHEYPSRVAFELLRDLFENPSDGNMVHIIENRQDGQDAISRVKSTLDETMVIAHENIDKVIARGHDIDELVERSANLSASSKMFYKTAKKHNSCCQLS